MDKMQKRTAMSLILSSLLLGTFVISGCGPEAALQSGQVAPVSVQVNKAINGWISKGPVYIGTVQPEQEVEILPKVPGKVASINVNVGSKVKKGDTLFTLDDTDLRNAVNQAQASVGTAQAGVQAATTQQQSSVNQASSGSVQAKSSVIQAQNAVNQANNVLTQAENNVKTAKQGLDDAQTNKDRYEQLFQQNSVPKSQLEQYQSAYVAAQAAYDNAQKSLQTAQSGLATAQQSLENATKGYETAQAQEGVAQSKASIDVSNQTVNAAQATLQTAQDRLAEATVPSPFDGIVGVKNLEVGDYINPDIPPAQPPLVIANLDTAKVLVYIPAAEINHVKVGDPVMLKSVALNSYFKGEIKHVSPLDNQGKGYPVEVFVSNPDLQLKKGMVTEVKLTSSSDKQGILIPTSAIEQNNGKSYVFISNNNTAKRQEITVGEQEGSQTLVTKGVKDGDVIITNQLGLIDDGAKISIEQNSPNSGNE
jgi:HlyD family secretion protein